MINKKSRTIKEQVALLKKRGMLFRDEEVAELFLSHISYYRLKGYWWDMQSDQTLHTFKSNTYFEDVIELYYFDKELRVILFSAIESIEIALRTKMIYHLSQSYGGLFHFKQELFVDEEGYKRGLDDLRTEFLRSSENFAKEFKAKYGIWDNGQCVGLKEEPDSWVIFEAATFGSLSKMYKNLRHQLPEKSQIANDFGLNLHSELSSWLEAISYFRNIIAHHSRVWSRNMVKRPMGLKKPRNAWVEHHISEVQQKKPYGVIIAMLYMCNAINEGKSFKDKLLHFIDTNQQISLDKLGFFPNWHSEPIWQ